MAMKQARGVLPALKPDEAAQDEVQAWEPLDGELWIPYRVRGSWRGGVLG
jgi:hypothetical protein